MKIFKNKISLVIIGILIAVTAVSAGVTISLVYNSTVSDTATVGENTLYTDGLVITLIEKSPYTLTYDAIDETDTQKHEITYVYGYEFIDAEMDINVSSLSDDIVIKRLESTDSTISITFSLNQEGNYDEGQVINVLFYFEGVEQVIEAININTASKEEMVSVGINEVVAQMTVDKQPISNYTDINGWACDIGVGDMIIDYQHLVDEGLITFE